MTKWIWPTAAALAFVAAGVAGYLALLGPLAGPADSKHLRLAINPWPGYELLYLAHVRELYAAEGLNVELIQFSTLDDARRSYERGQVDAIATTISDVMQVFHDSGEMPEVILVTDYSNGGDVIIARGAEIAGVAALKGKTVAVEHMFGRFVLDRALRKHRLSLRDVRLYEASVLDGSDLLARRKVDAIVTYAPHSFAAREIPGARTIFTTREAPKQVFDVVAARPDALERIPGLKQKITRVWARALAELRAHPGESIRIMARREGISDDEFRAALADVHLVSEAEQAEMMRADGHIQQAIRVLESFDGWEVSVSQAAAPAPKLLKSAPSLGKAE